MKKLLSALAFIAMACAPLLAHHSFASQYDRNKSMTVKGVVTKVDWRNPHVYFYLDVTDEASGAVTNWAFETGNLSTLMRGGWRKTTLKQGEVVTVEAFRARDGSNLANSRTVTKSDGTKIFQGTQAAPEYAGQ
jgi:Family of unknown function (DUF6152)